MEIVNMISPCKNCEFEKENKTTHPQCQKCKKIDAFQEFLLGSKNYQKSDTNIFTEPLSNGARQIPPRNPFYPQY